MKITKLDDFVEGMAVVFDYGSATNIHGVVHKYGSETRLLYNGLCIESGHCIPMPGYGHSLLVTRRSFGADLFNSGLLRNVTTVSNRSEKRSILYGRVKLIKAIIASANSPFLQEEHIKKCLTTVLDRIKKDSAGHFLSCDRIVTDMVSYATKPYGKHCMKGRVQTTLGRYIRRNLKLTRHDISEKDLQQLCRMVLANLQNPDKLDISIINGSKITKAYRDGFGIGTCMTGECARYVKLYEINPDVVSMVTYKDEARALLWKCSDGSAVLDRIYPNDGVHVSIIERWAYSNGIIVRKGHGAPRAGDPVPLQDSSYKTVKVEHKGVFPYMDTFRYAKETNDKDAAGTKKLILSNNIEDAEMELNSTAGSCRRIRNATCHNCNCRSTPGNVDSFITVQANTYCRSCAEELFFRCPACNNMSDISDVVTLATHEIRICNTCAERETAQCSSCGAREMPFRLFGGENPVCATCFNRQQNTTQTTTATNNTQAIDSTIIGTLQEEGDE